MSPSGRQKLLACTLGGLVAVSLVTAQSVAKPSLEADLSEPEPEARSPSFQFGDPNPPTIIWEEDRYEEPYVKPSAKDASSDEEKEPQEEVDQTDHEIDESDGDAGAKGGARKRMETVTSKNWVKNARDLIPGLYPYAGIALMEEMQRAIDRALKGKD